VAVLIEAAGWRRNQVWAEADGVLSRQAQFPEAPGQLIGSIVLQAGFAARCTGSGCRPGEVKARTQGRPPSRFEQEKRQTQQADGSNRGHRPGEAR